MLPREHDRLPFAVTSLERKFIMTPMSDGLRLAGTVVFAGLDAPPSMALYGIALAATLFVMSRACRWAGSPRKTPVASGM